MTAIRSRRDMQWIPLHVHSQYSLLNATCSLKSLVEAATGDQLPALALTDSGNLYGAIEFYRACQTANLQPILGCQLLLAPLSRHEKRRLSGSPLGSPLILLAKDRRGYRNLCQLSSIAHLEGFYYQPRIDREALTAHCQGLICLVGAVDSTIGRAILQQQEELLQNELRWLRDVFGADLFFEVQRHRMAEEEIRQDQLEQESWKLQHYRRYIDDQETVLHRLRQLGQEHGIPCLATQGSRYIARRDWKALEILMNVHSGEPRHIWQTDSLGNRKQKILNPKRQTQPSHVLHFRQQAEMVELFADFPAAIAATVEVAARCRVELDLHSKHYPVFIPPALAGQAFSPQQREEEVERYLRSLCQAAIGRRYCSSALQKVQQHYPEQDSLQVVQQRLEKELAIISGKGMCDYLLIVYDFIRWAKEQRIPVGPGRGSGSSSIILYLLQITDIEPLSFDLFFERFINPERLLYPDIDVDICMERRAELIAYIVQKYGSANVAQVITFGTMKARMAIKDVGRVLNLPIAKVNEIAKLIPEELNITLDKALQTDPELKQRYASDREVEELIDLGKVLEGSIRNTSTHAAGLIICSEPLVRHLPLCQAKDSQMYVTQYAMQSVEAVGMLKIDLLGLKTLTSMQKTVDAIADRHGVTIDCNNLPLDDAATFALLSQGKTQGIFQVESVGMQELLKQLQVSRFEEIVAVGALYRPGPMEMIPTFIERKHGREKIALEHPAMSQILAETYGIMVYQEQVMQIASTLAGYSLGEGDVLRRAMGKKDHREMQQQRRKFCRGAARRGIAADVAQPIFDKIEKFASYGFPKSHAVAYGSLIYSTAYLKANYPQEWMAALLTCDRDDLSKVARIIAECQGMGIAVLPPDVNASTPQFTATDAGIRFSLAAIKGIGSGVVEMICQERQQGGPFASLRQFLQRIDLRKVGKKSIETLIAAGGFDCTAMHRGQLLQELQRLYEPALQEQKEAASGVLRLFSNCEEAPPSDLPPLELPEMLKKEKELLGFYLTAHPLDTFAAQRQRLSCILLRDLVQLPPPAVGRCACIVEDLQLRLTARSHSKFAILTVSDGSERFEVVVWPQLYSEKGHLCLKNQLLFAIVSSRKKGHDLALQLQWLDDLATVDAAAIRDSDRAFDQAKLQLQKAPRRRRVESATVQKTLLLAIDAERARLSHIMQIRNILRRFPGTVPVVISFYRQQQRFAEVAIDSMWGVTDCPQLSKGIAAVPSLLQVRRQQQRS